MYHYLYDTGKYMNHTTLPIPALVTTLKSFLKKTTLNSLQLAHNATFLPKHNDFMLYKIRIPFTMSKNIEGET